MSSCNCFKLGMCGIVLFRFGFLRKTWDSVRNEFGSVRLKKSRLGSDIIVLFATHVIAE